MYDQRLNRADSCCTELLFSFRPAAKVPHAWCKLRIKKRSYSATGLQLECSWVVGQNCLSVSRNGGAPKMAAHPATFVERGKMLVAHGQLVTGKGGPPGEPQHQACFLFRHWHVSQRGVLGVAHRHMRLATDLLDVLGLGLPEPCLCGRAATDDATNSTLSEV